MKLGFFTVFVQLLIFQISFSQQSFENEVAKLLSQPEYRNASVGFHIMDLSSGETIFQLNEEKPLIPASTLKLVTSATALEILGADYRFTTKIGFTGKIAGKTLKGDLAIIGGGDPVLGSEYFIDHYLKPHFLEIWAKKLKAAGIQHVDGNLILDCSLYGNEKIPPTWIWEDMANYYGAGANALTVYDNMFRITFKSPKRAGEQTQIIAIYPKIDGLDIVNEVVSSDINRDMAFVFGSPIDKTRFIRGTIPKNRNAFTIKAAIHHPEELLSTEFLSFLAKERIFISGEIQFKTIEKKKFQVVYIQESPTLAEIVKVLNYKSVNLFAEHLVNQVAAENNNLGDRKKGLEIIKLFWHEKGIQTENIFMEDGSGLSHFNAVSPIQFTSILLYMYNFSLQKDAFFCSLPSAGSGTLSGFSSDFFPNGSLKAKSGSMTRVRCYAGYLNTDSGKNFAFSAMFNHFVGNHSKLSGEVEKLLFELKSAY